MFKVAFLALFCLIHYGNSARILGFVPTASFSHQIVFTKFWKELSKRGHQVTVVTTDPIKDASLTNLTEIDVSFTYVPMKKHIAQMQNGGVLNTLNAISKMQEDMLKFQLNYSKVQDLMNTEKHKFDVVLVEILYPELLAVGKLHNCPTIGISSFDMIRAYHEQQGNMVHPVAYPEMIFPFHTDLSFVERVISVIFEWFMSFLRLAKLKPKRNHFIKEYFKDESMDVDEIVNNIDLMFLNVNPALFGPRAFNPSTIPIGGFNNIQEGRKLPKDLQKFLDEANEGVVYFSLGSNVQSKSLEGDKLKAIMSALKELPYKVLWKFEKDDLEGKPENVKIIKWAPQQDILRHKNIKVFVSQGGLQSTEEAIYYHVPIVGLPFFGDQERNIRIAEGKGIAKVVKHKPFLRYEDLRDAILDVAQNEKYKIAIENLENLMSDQPMSGLEKAIWWTEYVIRHKGAKHLKTPLNDIPWFKYYLVDVYGFLTFLIFTLLIIVKRIFVLFKKILKPSYTGASSNLFIKKNN